MVRIARVVPEVSLDQAFDYDVPAGDGDRAGREGPGAVRSAPDRRLRRRLPERGRSDFTRKLKPVLAVLPRARCPPA